MSQPRTRLARFIKPGDILVDRTVLASPQHPVVVNEASISGTVKLSVQDGELERRVELAADAPVETFSPVYRAITLGELADIIETFRSDPGVAF